MSTNKFEHDGLESLMAPREGTVAEFLATPPQLALPWRCFICVCFIAGVSLVLWAASIFAVDFLPQFLPISEMRFFSLAVGIVSIVCASGFLAFVLARRLPRHDVREGVKRVVVRAMLDCPRMGVSRQTEMVCLGIRCRYVRGSRQKAVECWMLNCPFTQKDFSGISPSDFAAFDYEVVNGRLYVYFDADTAEDVRERMYGKAGGRNARN